MRRSNSTASLNTYDLLKLAALFLMTLDHFGQFVMDADWLRVLGRAAAPAFCFLVGFNDSYRFRKGLLIGAVLMSAVDWGPTASIFPLNILWSILFARLALTWLEKHPLHPLLLIGGCLIWLPVSVVVMQYGTLVLLWALWGRSLRHRDMRTNPYYMAACILGALLVNMGSSAWTQEQVALALVINLLMALLLERFTLKPVRVQSKPLHWLSRHALAYYVAHRALFIGIGIFAA